MTRIYTLLLILIGFAVLTSSFREPRIEPAVRILSSDVQKGANVLMIRVAFDLSELKLDPGRTITVYPVLEGGSHRVVMPEIVINGRRKHILYQRRPKPGVFMEIYRKNGTRQTVQFAHTIDLEEWMSRSKLVLEVDICGCGRDLHAQRIVAVQNVRLDRQPLTAYLMPPAEAVKSRTEQGQAYLDFPVNQTAIDPEYRRNPDELSRIRKTIDVVRNDTNTQITQVSIHGYASPEGAYAHNAKLARERAQSLCDYVQRQYLFADSVLRVSSTPEDWGGLERCIRQANYPQAEKLLAIITNTGDPDAREQQLKELDGGVLYRMLLTDCYSALRRSDYQVSYTVRGFCGEEGRALLHTRPQHLSLQELYLIARTYAEGSPEFDEVFDIAVRLFPEDPIANLNASSVALRKRDFELARKYLLKADASRPETMNNLGVLALLGDDRQADARTLFMQAAALGLAVAQQNLNDLE